eukprot:TRINITY_DN10392_c0_g1_i4.p2 TRINITY_DN10392_c0_g1~~TRINITY_DN10392_c0_g1_i4.p2  ORF type:complete len:161 (+),score=35.46 TRINITY_DN10392_c0_g1_i4:1695-2177(+)
MIFYIILTPMTLTYLYVRFKSTQEESLKLLLKPFVKGYRPGCKWFELFMFAFRLMFVIIRDLFHLANDLKLVFLSILMVIVLWVEARFRPHLEEKVQDLSLLWVVVSLCTLISSSFFASQSATPSQTTAFGVILVVFIVTATLISLFPLTTKHSWTNRSK